MAKQTFSVGQVLTAAQMTSLQETAMGGGAASAKTASYTLVAADAGTTISMTSTSATTITVNTGLFAAGDTVFIQNLGSGTCTITAGTATVTTSSSLALAKWEGGTLYFTSASAAIFFKADVAGASGGMTLLDTLTLSGTSVTSTTFSSAYEQLIIYMKQAYISAGSNDIVFRLNADTGSNYAYSGNRVTTTTNTGVGSSSATSIVFGVIGNKTTDIQKNYAIINLMRPKDTDAVYVQATGIGFDENAVRYSQRTSGIYDSSAAITSFTIFTPSSDTFSGGNVYIYGVK